VPKKSFRIPLDSLPPFDRQFFNGSEAFTRIGTGEIGGKAHGLAMLNDLLKRTFDQAEFPEIRVTVPILTVVATDWFDEFMKANGLYDISLSEARDDEIALAFQKGNLSTMLVGDLRALITKVHSPLAVRSSSLLEDAMFEPFAGVYATKMIPNNQYDIDTRFHKLVEAIKFVYASTYFRSAKEYIRATGQSIGVEKMAVIVQEVVGLRHDDRFYPNISGVARSYNYYPSGHAKPEQGVVNLALGLGKTIVDGGVSYSYSPAHPNARPLARSIDELLDLSQTEFWAVNMGKPPEYDPICETEFMVKSSLPVAEEDGTLAGVASTYLIQEDRRVPSINMPGPRLLDFAPILQYDLIPLTALLKRLLELCRERIQAAVEIEFALTLDSEDSSLARFGFLQVRPMVVSEASVEVKPEELRQPNVLLASESAMGNGVNQSLRTIVYVKPESFDPAHSSTIAIELGDINRKLFDQGESYLLLGIGRWGSSEPWLGIPVDWGQIAGAKVIVEATLPKMDVELSQGSHFFHNISSFQVLYFSVAHSGQYRIDWEWLEHLRQVSETKFVRCVEADSPLTVKVDGRTGRGVILHG
jgi:Pyruvate phosphate dikinase, AMP/ATP-binding domain